MLLIYTHNITSRFQYIGKHIFQHILGIEVAFTQKIEDFINHSDEKLSYTHTPLGNEFFIQCSSLLFEVKNQPQNIKVGSWENLPIFYKTSEKSMIPFDIFSAAFYLVSRFEEYDNSFYDDFGRYKIEESLAYKNDFLKIPLVDLWALELLKVLNKSFPKLTLLSPTPKLPIPLIYSTHPYKFLHKSLFRHCFQLVSNLLNLNILDVINHLVVLTRLKKDPWDTFEELKKLFSKKKIKPIFFFMFGNLSYYDQVTSTTNSSYRTLIKSTADYFNVALLPTYEAKVHVKVMKTEIKKLEELLHKNIDYIRFHWGLNKQNEAYSTLIAMGIKAEFSMGYSNHIGFRASTAVPLYFYDFKSEQETPLRFKPIIATQSALNSNKLKSNLKKIMQYKYPSANSEPYIAFSNTVIEPSFKNTKMKIAFEEFVSSLE